jgi:hypothetical protein
MRAIAAAKRRAHYEDERQRHGLYEALI